MACSSGRTVAGKTSSIGMTAGRRIAGTRKSSHTRRPSARVRTNTVGTPIEAEKSAT